MTCLPLASCRVAGYPYQIMFQTALSEREKPLGSEGKTRPESKPCGRSNPWEDGKEGSECEDRHSHILFGSCTGHYAPQIVLLSDSRFEVIASVSKKQVSSVAWDSFS